MEVRKKKMSLEEKDLDGTETAIAGGRNPLEMVAGKKFRVVLRGAGVFEGGQKKDFDTGELMDEKIRNAALVVCNPEDVEEVYTVSGPVESVMGASILNMQEKDENGVLRLKGDMLNAVGYLGMEEVKTKKEYNKGYKKLFWDPEKDKKGNVVKMKGDLPAETVGAEQRESTEVEEEGEDVVM